MKSLLPRLLLLLLVASGCDSARQSQAVEGVDSQRILCTTEMIAGPLRSLVGSHAQVTSLMGAGVDPHLYKPSPGDVRKLLEADLVLYHGHHLEGRMGDILRSHHSPGGNPKRSNFIAVTEAIAVDKLIHTSAGTVDPHLWMDISLWSEVIEQMNRILVEFDPHHADDYDVRLEQLKQELAQLDSDVATTLALIPPPHRILVTAHDAFAYFGRRYNLEVKGIQGISTESEASIARVNELVKHLCDRSIPAIFVESTVSRRNVEALIEGCASFGHTLRVGGVLYSDAPGPIGSDATTWRQMVLHNARVIAEGLR